MTNAESVATLDARFPVTGATDHIAYSTNGTSEFAGLARTPIGATGWAAATNADPSVKANANALTSAAATSGGTVTHYAIFSAASGGTQRTDWTALTASRTLAINDQLSHAAGAIAVTLT
jgi:hypothetical protein